ncbi:hypothetical protein J1605_016261 [Eschrichtius robustus]|uniref:HSac2 domain-containing protein n=1 Tax=Eschrichtius robustus TaxID=9764 RepID=A0AB34G7K8_ESCRO|nr:hypothetical protein J1605_016261 [Eschrichtius robustus]
MGLHVVLAGFVFVVWKEGMPDWPEEKNEQRSPCFQAAEFCCMRLHYRYKEASGYFHTLRAVMHNPEEDGKDTLQCIAEMLQITKEAMGLDVPIIEKKPERKSSRPHEDIIGIRSQNQGSLAQGKIF